MRDSLRERKKRQTHERLYEAARDLFAEQGFTATTLQQIAQRAEVSVQTIRNYFGDKDGFLAYQLERSVRREFADQEGLVFQLLRRSSTAEWTAPAQAAGATLEGLQAAHSAPRNHIANLMRVAACHPEASPVATVLYEALLHTVEFGRERGVARKDVPAELLASTAASLICGGLLNWVQTPSLPPRASGFFILAFVHELIAGNHVGGLPPDGLAFMAEIEAIRPPDRAPREARRPDALKTRIYEVGRRRILDVGVAATRVNDIAEELSISPLTLHYHYGTKDGLIAEMLWDLAMRMRAWLEELRACAAPDLGLGLAGRLMAEPLVPPELEVDLLRVSFMHPEGVEASEEFLRIAIAVVEDGQRHGRVRSDFGASLLGRLLVTLALGTLLRRNQDPALHHDDATRHAIAGAMLLLAPR